MTATQNEVRYTDGMPIEYVSDSARLAQLCASWAQEPFLAVDTEFERTSTFYARIGLLQIADSGRCYLVDPITVDDWTPFKVLLATPSCTLIMHSCSEDLNLLQTFLGCMPVSLFDTQLAAAFLGLGYSVSYQALVEQLLGIEVAKDETRSDWIRRPLSEKQIQYAAADVRYLAQLRELLADQIANKDMTGWLQAECQQQLVTASKTEDESQWQNYYAGISNAWRLDTKGLQVLQLLCVWREQKARQKNKPRSWIVKDNDLMSLCGAISTAIDSDNLTLDDISTADGVDRHFLSRYANELFLVLSAIEVWGEVDSTLLNKPLNAAMRKKLKLSKQAATAKAEELGMSPELLGRKKFLMELLRGYHEGDELNWPEEYAPWRRELLESDLMAILSRGES